MHTQSKTMYARRRIPWYRTDRNGTITFRSPGTPGGGTPGGGTPGGGADGPGGLPATGGDLIRKVVEGERDADVGKVVTQDGVQPW